MIELLILLLCLGFCMHSGWRLITNNRDVSENSLLEGDGKGTDRELSRLRRILINAGLDLNPRLFVAGLGVVALALFLCFIELFPDAYSLSAMAAGGLVVVVVLLLADFGKWRINRFEKQLIESMDLMNSALRGGLSPRQALVVAADAGKGRLASELGEVSARLDLGLPLQDAISRLTGRFDCEGVRLFTQVLIANWHSGSDFSALLTAVSKLLHSRMKLRTKVASQLSGARYAALFCGLLPYILVPFFLWKQPGWLDALTEHPYGPGVLFAAVMLQVIGFLWLRRVLRSSI